MAVSVDSLESEMQKLNSGEVRVSVSQLKQKLGVGAGVRLVIEPDATEPTLETSPPPVPTSQPTPKLSLVEPVQFSAGIGVPQTVFIIVLVLNSSLWLIPAGNSNSSTVHEEPPQMRAPPPLMRDHPSWPVEEPSFAVAPRARWRISNSLQVLTTNCYLKPIQ